MSENNEHRIEMFIRDFNEDTNRETFINELEPVNEYNRQLQFPKKLGYSEVEKAIRSSYYTKQDYYSSSFDIFSAGIKETSESGYGAGSN